MKLLTRERREFLIKAATKSLRHKIKRRKKKNPKTDQLRINKSKPTNPKRRINIRLDAPAEFNLATAESRTELLSFLRKLSTGLGEGARVQISFDKTNKLYPSGVLPFVAMVESLLLSHPGMITCNYPADSVVEQLFQHIGLLDKLGLTPRVAITADNVLYWHYVRGTSTDTSDFTNLFSAYASKLDESTSSGLYDSMSEAVTNIIQHAYECERFPCISPENGWWMFAQHKDEKLTVVIYDLGIGIPQSLRNKPEMKEILAAPLRQYKKRRDTSLIEIAVQSKRTRTKLSHRGKGLPDMVSIPRQSRGL